MSEKIRARKRSFLSFLFFFFLTRYCATETGVSVAGRERGQIYPTDKTNSSTYQTATLGGQAQTAKVFAVVVVVASGGKGESEMRRAAKVDENQRAIVAGLRAAGATVKPLHHVGGGVPDLLVGFRGTNHLLEVKGRRGKLTAAQILFFDDWRGRASVVRSVDEALRAIGAV